jgi:hypothetical protein
MALELYLSGPKGMTTSHEVVLWPFITAMTSLVHNGLIVMPPESRICLIHDTLANCKITC